MLVFDLCQSLDGLLELFDFLAVGFGVSLPFQPLQLVFQSRNASDHRALVTLFNELPHGAYFFERFSDRLIRKAVCQQISCSIFELIGAALGHVFLKEFLHLFLFHDFLFVLQLSEHVRDIL